MARLKETFAPGAAVFNRKAALRQGKIFSGGNRVQCADVVGAPNNYRVRVQPIVKARMSVAHLRWEVTKLDRDCQIKRRLCARTELRLSNRASRFRNSGVSSICKAARVISSAMV